MIILSHRKRFLAAGSDAFVKKSAVFFLAVFLSVCPVVIACASAKKDLQSDGQAQPDSALVEATLADRQAPRIISGLLEKAGENYVMTFAEGSKSQADWYLVAEGSDPAAFSKLSACLGKMISVRVRELSRTSPWNIKFSVLNILSEEE